MPEVLNPYYGDEMLTCGSVTDTLSRQPGESRPVGGQKLEKKDHSKHNH